MVLARRWGNLVRGYAAGRTGRRRCPARCSCWRFPGCRRFFARCSRCFWIEAAVLNLVRAAIAFGLMAIPATALGTTLPLLSKPLESATGSYGVALGRLYGVNTLGAVAGTLLAELVLIPGTGPSGSGLFAAGVQSERGIHCAADRAHPLFECAPRQGGRRRGPSRRMAGALSPPPSWRGHPARAGGDLVPLPAAVPARHNRDLRDHARGGAVGHRSGRRASRAPVAPSPGCPAGWRGLRRRGRRPASLRVMPRSTEFCGGGRHGGRILLRAVLVSVVLMGPVCLLSGVLFTALGEQLRARMTDAAATTGVLTLANTLGAMTGSLLAAFVALPALGLESSFFLLAFLYGLVVLLVPSRGGARWRRAAPAPATALALAAFPFGKMGDSHYRTSRRGTARG